MVRLLESFLQHVVFYTCQFHFIDSQVANHLASLVNERLHGSFKMSNASFWVTLTLLLPLLLLAISLMVVVVKVGPKRFEDAKRLQGGLASLARGRVEAEFNIDNDPRLVEGMVRDRKSGRYEKNNRLSDDYLKALFGS